MDKGDTDFEGQAMLPARPAVPHRGRGAVSNVQGRFEVAARERFDDGWGSDDGADGVDHAVDDEGAVPAGEGVVGRAAGTASDRGRAAFAANGACPDGKDGAEDGVVDGAAEGAEAGEAAAPATAAAPASSAAPAAARAGVHAGVHAEIRMTRLKVGESHMDFAVPAAIRTMVTEEHAKSILSRNASPDIPFNVSLNPYRGCEHGCIYCFARPSHSYLGLSPGLDFETRLFAKVNAAALLRRELAHPGYVPESIALGVNTDAYQPCERELGLTRQVLEVLRECDHPVGLITKSSLIERDIDLLAPMAEKRLVLAAITLTTLDPAISRTLEPRAAAPARRLRTIRTLVEAGIPVSVSVAPVIPFVTEPDIERILEAAHDAGASGAHYTVLRLPWEVNTLFHEWLQAHFPDRAQRVMNRVREMRGGKDYDSDFATRMHGEGVWADLIRQRFTRAADKLGLLLGGRRHEKLDCSLFRKPQVVPSAASVAAAAGRAAVKQLDLF